MTAYLPSLALLSQLANLGIFKMSPFSHINIGYFQMIITLAASLQFIPRLLKIVMKTLVVELLRGQDGSLKVLALFPFACKGLPKGRKKEKKTM